MKEVKSVENRWRYIYGPVPSWRLGSSLGIDLLSRDEKICSFDCTYCQIGRTRTPRTARGLYVPVDDVLSEIGSLPDIPVDYLTFSGRGEPTLAANLGEAIRAVKRIRPEKVAVITNSSLLPDQGVRMDLLAADLVIAKLDAPTEEIFARINRPAKGLHLSDILVSIVEFRKMYGGKLALQVMFTRDNKDHAAQIADIARALGPDEVQVNTPLRPCDESPLAAPELLGIKTAFERQELTAMTVYESAKKKVTPLSDRDTLKRRGKET